MEITQTFTKNSGAITASSRLKVWWLQRHGYRIVGSSSEPHLGLFGQVRYRKKWVLLN